MIIKSGPLPEFLKKVEKHEKNEEKQEKAEKKEEKKELEDHNLRLKSESRSNAVITQKTARKNKQKTQTRLQDVETNEQAEEMDSIKKTDSHMKINNNLCL